MSSTLSLIHIYYMPPYHEKFNHFSFLNTTAVNPATGTPGAMEFAGNYGGATGIVSCNCKTPVMTYWKNYGPRIGLVYSVNDKSVIRVGVGITYSVSYTHLDVYKRQIQGCTGISLLLEAMAKQRKRTPEDEDLLDVARSQVRVTINEARQAVWNLRRKEEDIDLPGSLLSLIHI